MRISGLDVALTCDDRRRFIHLKLETEDGRTGLAEAPLPVRPAPLLATLDALKSSPVIGADATKPARLSQLLHGLEPAHANSTAAAAIALVEMAGWDLAAKLLGIPLHRLFGGAIHDSIRSCAAGWEPSEGAAETLTDAARRVVGLGYTILRFDPFQLSGEGLNRSELGRTVRSCEMVRAAVGPDVAIWVSFGGRFGPADAIRFAKALKRIEPAGIIEPLSPAHRRALSVVAQRVGLPLVIGERVHHCSAAVDAIVHGSVGLVLLDPSVACGFSATRTIAGLAEAHGVGVALRTSGGSISLASAIHLGASLPDLQFIEHPVSDASDESIAPPIVVHGAFPVFDT